MLSEITFADEKYFECIIFKANPHVICNRFNLKISIINLYRFFHCIAQKCNEYVPNLAYRWP